MSDKFMMVKGFYDSVAWSIQRVRSAVVKGWITNDEFTIITGEDYE